VVLKMNNKTPTYPQETFYKTLETQLLNNNFTFVEQKIKTMTYKSKLSFIFYLKDNQTLELLRRFTQ